MKHFISLSIYSQFKLYLKMYYFSVLDSFLSMPWALNWFSYNEAKHFNRVLILTDKHLSMWNYNHQKPVFKFSLTFERRGLLLNFRFHSRLSTHVLVFAWVYGFFARARICENWVNYIFRSQVDNFGRSRISRFKWN